MNDVDRYQAYEQERQSCAKELTGVIEDFTHRYPAGVVLGALAEHFGAGCWALMQNGRFTPEFVRELLQFVEKLAFHTDGPEPALQPPGTHGGQEH